MNQFPSSQVIKDGATDSKGGPQPKLRRPFGIAVYQVTDIVTGRYKSKDDIFVPLNAVGNDDVETAIRKVVGLSKGTTTAATGTGQCTYFCLLNSII